MRRDYHDYVIKDGRLVGRFEEMYREADEVPWHQDESAYRVSTDLDVAAIRHFAKACGVRSIGEVGAGLGYFAHRLRAEISDPPVEVTGFDVSATAVAKARARFPDVAFEVLDIVAGDTAPHAGRFDLVVQKDVLWYVLDRLDLFAERIGLMTRRHVYFAQSFPPRRPFLGSDRFPDARALVAWLGSRFRIVHSFVERLPALEDCEYAHVFMERAAPPPDPAPARRP